MRRDEAAAIGELGGEGLGQFMARIEELHRAIADRAFGASGPGATPARVAHDGIASGVYAAARGLGSLTVRAGGLAAALARPVTAASLGDGARGALALATLNGFLGDRLSERKSPLALGMDLRLRGEPLAIDRETLAAAYPDAGPRVAIFLHGLMETEAVWRWYGHEPYGERMRRELGHTPLWVRYNTGRHISENGDALALLLEQVLDAWPGPIGELVLVGHSMGGLVVRSACHHALERKLAWATRVRHVVYLGSPHFGAPLEQAVHRAGIALDRLGETRPIATVLRSRSAGIKDLRHGALLEADWLERDLDALLGDDCEHVPLLDTARHYVVGATLTRDPEHPLGRVMGDLLVRMPSATGGRSGRRHLVFELEHRHHVGPSNHFRLVNDPKVYLQLVRWLRSNPQRALPAPAA